MVDEDEFVYPAWNHRTNEYGIVITQPKFLLKTIFRNYCYLQGKAELIPDHVYFVSINGILNRTLNSIPVESLANIERSPTISSNTTELEFSPLLGKVGDAFGIAFARIDQVGDYICDTEYFSLIPNDYEFPEIKSEEEVTFLPLSSILTAKNFRNSFQIHPRAQVRFTFSPLFAKQLQKGYAELHSLVKTEPKLVIQSNLETVIDQKTSKSDSRKEESFDQIQQKTLTASSSLFEVEKAIERELSSSSLSIPSLPHENASKLDRMIEELMEMERTSSHPDLGNALPQQELMNASQSEKKITNAIINTGTIQILPQMQHRGFSHENIDNTPVSIENVEHTIQNEFLSISSVANTSKSDRRLFNESNADATSFENASFSCDIDMDDSFIPHDLTVIDTNIEDPIPSPTIFDPFQCPVKLPTIEEIESIYQLKVHPVSLAFPSYTEDSMAKILESMLDRKNFSEHWDTLKANRNWRCVWTINGDSNTEAYCVPEIHPFLMPKKTCKYLIRNLDYFQLKDIHQHLQDNPCLSFASKNDLWKILKTQGWRGMKTAEKFLKPPIRFIPAFQRVNQLTPGFHIFSSFESLLYYIARFPYLLQSDEQLLGTLERFRWNVRMTSSEVLFRNEWYSLKEIRTLFWTFPSKFFAHYIFSEEDEQRVLCSLGLKQKILEEDLLRREEESQRPVSVSSVSFNGESSTDSRNQKRKWDEYDGSTVASDSK